MLKRLKMSSLDKVVREALRIIAAEAARLNQPVYIVGGIVRDLLLGRASRDLDIVVEGRGISLARAFARRTAGVLTVHERFLTATVVCPSGLAVDFATARKEHYAHPGDLPVVTESGMRDDLFRRDFTINALAAQMNSRGQLTLVDYFDGLKDLQDGKVRILHEASFQDDPTRILRAIRFEQRFGFRFDRRTLNLLKAAIKGNFPARVKAERYFAEWRNILSEPDVVRCLRRMAHLRALDRLFFGLKIDCRVLKQVIKNIRELSTMPCYQSSDWQAVLLLSFLAGFPAQAIEKILPSLPLTREERDLVRFLPQVKDLRRILRYRKLRASQIYQILLPVNLKIIFFIRTTTSDNIVNARIDEYLAKTRYCHLSMNGRDVMQIKLGISGKEIGQLLARLLLERIDGHLPSRPAQMRRARQLLLTTKPDCEEEAL